MTLPVLTRRQFLPTLAAANLPAATRPPNVVFILADDLGWRDTSLYGPSLADTPNIARLARRGMRFEQAYSANPLCSPTRASILTGLYPARIGITTPSAHLPQVILEQKLQDKAPPTQRALQANSITRLKHEYFTLAEAMKEAGYATAHFGKWHLGHEPYDALRQGFDFDAPHAPVPAPVGGYLGPWQFWQGKGDPGEHIEDRLSADAVRFMTANKDRPFYLNYWAFSVHSPWNAKASLIEKYRGRAQGEQRNALYAAMVETFDQAVGRLLDGIDAAGVAGNTIVVLFSDNGGVHWTPGTEQARAVMHPEFTHTPVTSNAPLRGGKATLYEGGTREPCVVAWPGVARPNSRSNQVISSVDFFPTLLEATGVRPAKVPQFDGISIVPALRGGRIEREAIFCHFPHYTPRTGGRPGTWVRHDDWKLIRFYHDNEDQTDRFELYNLRNDPGETRNLAAAHPDRVRQGNERINAFLRHTGAIVPKANPDYRAQVSSR